jgi:hypothetical protein
VQYFLYLAMAMYNELFLVWVALVLLTFQLLARLLLSVPASAFAVAGDPAYARRIVGIVLLVNGTCIALLWLSVIVPPLAAGLYPAGLAHFTTMIDRVPGDLFAPVYAVFLSLQMLALLAKIAWMNSVGVSAGPALVVIPIPLVGAVTAAVFALRPHLGQRIPRPIGPTW